MPKLDSVFEWIDYHEEEIPPENLPPEMLAVPVKEDNDDVEEFFG